MLDGSKSEFQLSVLEQISSDLSKLVNSNPDSKKFLKTLSQKTDIHLKTLSRILNQENRPNYTTVLKIYRFILGEFDDVKVVEKAPPVIKKYLKDSIPQAMARGIQYSSSVDMEIQKNPVFAEIYILAGTGKITKSEIAARFGKYGLEIVEQMLDKNVLAEIRAGEMILGPNQATITPESILSLGMQLIQSYGKASNSYELELNHMGLYAEGLSETGYQKWISIDMEAIAKKIQLTKNIENLGSKKAFTFMITETLVPKENGKEK